MRHRRCKKVTEKGEKGRELTDRDIEEEER